MSATPEAQQDIVNQSTEEEVSFRFCRECSNMLYPKEDRNASQLMFACRTCNFSEPAPTSCVWRNQLTNTVAETAGVTADVAQDPTLPRAEAKCPSCGHDEAVFFQSQQRTATTGMQLFFVCVACGHTYNIEAPTSKKDGEEGQASA